MKKLTRLIAVIAIALPLAAAVAKGKEAPTGVLNINTASVEELMTLPGIGRSKADAIVAFRQSHPFRSVDELTEVKGIGPKMMEKIHDHLTIGTAASQSPAQK